MRSTEAPNLTRRGLLWALGSGTLLAGCAAVTPAPADRSAVYRVVNRVTWGADRRSVDAAAGLGLERYLEQQLRASGDAELPPPVQAQIAALTISQTPLETLVATVESQRRSGDAGGTEEDRKAARQAYQQELSRLARECATRHVLRALYSPQQLREHMTWFWFNHFSVHQYKGPIRAMLGDYEERAIRPHALGRFRDLLAATMRHPAMLVYLDNRQNAANRLNENYARELLELHTMGVDGGYQQRDVQELARILTGWGVNLGEERPALRGPRAAQYVRDGNFEFNPNRHDHGDKTLLGRTIRGRGMAEVDEVLDLVATHPSTARFVSRRIAQYLLSDEPPEPLVASMADAFQRSGGDIAATLRVLVTAPEFASPSVQKFKDPMHFVISAVRASYQDRTILNAQPIFGWLNRAAEGLYNRQTPDGYPLTSPAWTGSGQIASRIELARTLGSGSAGLFRSDDPQRPGDQPAFPQLQNALYFEVIAPMLSAQTRDALAQAGSPQEWNTLYLSSPEFMYR